jgi:hypothetical protein
VSDADLVERISNALHRAWDGRVMETSTDQLVRDIAEAILKLRAVGREAYVKGEREAIAHLRAVGGFETYLKEQGGEWLPSALLEATEKGLLPEIVALLNGGHPVDPDRYRIAVAYAEVHFHRNRPPLIGELLKELGINKPSLNKANEKEGQEWRRINNQERRIREILKEFDLPLAAGKRGRPKRGSPDQG